MRFYSDVSHFRAPYKNLSIRGFGAVENGAGPPPGATCPTTPAGVATVSVVGTDGVRRYKPQEADALVSRLHSWRSIFLTDTNVKIEPISNEELAAAAADPAYGATLEALRVTNWINQKLAEGYAIFAPFVALCPTPEVLTSKLGIQLGATPATDVAAMKAATEFPSPDMPMGAYLIEPARVAVAPPVAAEARIGPALWALGIVVVLGAGAYAMTRERRPRVGGAQLPASLRA